MYSGSEVWKETSLPQVSHAVSLYQGPWMFMCAGFIRYLESHGKSWNLISIPGIF